MNSLRGDCTAFLSREHGGNFLPGLAGLALFVNEIHEWFKPAVKGASAADSLSFR